ncbi:MAG: hypothetical protein WD079_01745 [Phycisphaeraceae bacterium]
MDPDLDGTHRLGVLASDRRAEKITQQTTAGTAAEKRKIQAHQILKQQFESLFYDLLDRRLGGSRSADIEGTATDDDGGIMIEMYLGEVAGLYAQAHDLLFLQFSVMENLVELTVGRSVLGAKLDDQERFAHSGFSRAC